MKTGAASASAAGENDLLCPSARSSWSDAVVIGVVGGTVEEPRITPTEQPFPVTPEILGMAGPVEPTEVFRFASRCQKGCCEHFQNNACQLAVGITRLLPEVSDDLPKCSIRASCRWFRQEGPAMCRRCPQIVTDQLHPTPVMVQIVTHIAPAPPAVQAAV